MTYWSEIEERTRIAEASGSFRRKEYGRASRNRKIGWSLAAVVLCGGGWFITQSLPALYKWPIRTAVALSTWFIGKRGFRHDIR